MVHDNPFGSEMDRLISLVGKGLRRSRAELSFMDGRVEAVVLTVASSWRPRKD